MGWREEKQEENYIIILESQNERKLSIQFVRPFIDCVF